MQKEELAFIGCRLIALFYAVKALETVGSFATSLIMWGSQSFDLPKADISVIYFQIIPIAFNGIIACLLWFGAGRIVRSLLSDTEFDQNSRSVSAEQVQSIAFATVGLFILTWGMTDLVNLLFRVYHMKQVSEFAYISTTLQAEGITIACQFILGLCLLIGSKGLSNVIFRLRQPKLNKI